MPRGTRAVRGARVEGSYHGHSEGELLAALIPEGELLAVNCWCDTSAVAVPQYLVRWEGRTLSCGVKGCESPGGDATVGTVVPLSFPNMDKWMERNGIPIPKFPRKVTIMTTRQSWKTRAGASGKTKV